MTFLDFFKIYNISTKWGLTGSKKGKNVILCIMYIVGVPVLTLLALYRHIVKPGPDWSPETGPIKTETHVKWEPM